MLYAITHTTAYTYTEPVSLCHNLVHLEPRALPQQKILQTQLSVVPEPKVVLRQTDFFGNPIAFFTIEVPHKKLSITVEHRVEVLPRDALDASQTAPWESAREALRADRSMWEAYGYTFDSRYIHRSDALAEYALPSFQPGRALGLAAIDLMERIHRDFRYDAQATTLATPLAEVLEHRHGVCQDFAHLMIGCLRSVGLAARYVSGYLRTNAPAGRERMIGADASHAWVAIFLPQVGWVDFDPTNNVCPSDQHVVIGWGRDYDDVSPVKGIIMGGGKHTMSVAVDVAPIPSDMAK